MNKAVTMSFSLDQETKKTIEYLAKTQRKSKSDVVRDLARPYQPDPAWEGAVRKLRSFAQRRGLHNEDDIEAFFG